MDPSNSNSGDENSTKDNISQPVAPPTSSASDDIQEQNAAACSSSQISDAQTVHPSTSSALDDDNNLDKEVENHTEHMEYDENVETFPGHTLSKSTVHLADQFFNGNTKVKKKLVDRIASILCADSEDIIDFSSDYSVNYRQVDAIDSSEDDLSETDDERKSGEMVASEDLTEVIDLTGDELVMESSKNDDSNDAKKSNVTNPSDCEKVEQMDVDDSSEEDNASKIDEMIVAEVIDLTGDDESVKESAEEDNSNIKKSDQTVVLHLTEEKKVSEETIEEQEKSAEEKIVKEEPIEEQEKSTEDKIVKEEPIEEQEKSSEPKKREEKVMVSINLELLPGIKDKLGKHSKKKK